MAEERIKKSGSDKPQDRGGDPGKGQQELTPEQLANVAGGNTEQVAKGKEQEDKHNIS